MTFPSTENYSYLKLSSKKILAGVKAVIFDFDGVFTDNRVSYLNGRQVKTRSYYDGQGVSLLRAIGIKVAIITGEKGISASLAKETVKIWNDLPSTKKNGSSQWPKVELFCGYYSKDKVTVASKWLNKLKIKPEECLVMGDDLVDLPLLKLANFKAVPISGEKTTRDLADFVSRRPGGSGAVRDLVNLILEVKGVDPYSLPLS
ncbi:MAG: 3-deoxy-D-manno-octulosonate 8-phosphate phosphatase (KDO 8-P phosphatase) [Microgenomates group bacterium GW2011_GWC1_38_12]|uniref:3-deoxy-D-manno-octulosonate 8-phosphate phosphatase KdsC n=1 Tax=Candidatus Vogelbacteria bacterium RIFOXYB1_FULL_42_16 TaxID=1802436 RepID=A0A1G2QEY1_9BACT|nr:MAG: 3-deoxy-D-manno-octulosonate 8-phosphate phosphatase (KDO 8-P phosphatase) [Microgenomates group bacterium GW2011_GWC1_38_12]KKS78129.1 MAG: 3-deoxy-D-manno-octulosonate 8-phosphate phosphatase (KDO 8-P phosphatase) [Parcubacteria group bacterium GW2011_GWB1_42_9]OHA59144.1 MAG: hypothetical protein A2370_03085 [Candidatus Vogelbacteria bacterium RIFOXYB1_FULL_42_16]